MSMLSNFKIKAHVLSFVLYAGIPTAAALVYASRYAPTEEDKMRELLPTSDHKKRALIEDTRKMQMFFDKMKQKDETQNKVFEDLLKQGATERPKQRDDGV